MGDTFKSEDKYKLKIFENCVKRNYLFLSSADKDVETGEDFCTISGNADWCSHCGKQYGDSSKN